MPVPEVSIQPSMLPPQSAHVSIDITWVRRADHSVTRVQVLDRPKGEVLALVLGSTPDLRDPVALREALDTIVSDLVEALCDHVAAPDPF